MSQRHFLEELERLKSHLLGMAGLAEDAVHNAVAALLQRDEARAQAVIESDAAIDALELEIDNNVISLLALQQPMARDLRLITAAMKISNDLERVGDHAVNIAEAVSWLIQSPLFAVPPEIEDMVHLAIEMLKDSLNAFVRGDSQLARDILQRDDRIDELHENNFRIQLTHMMEDPRQITAGMDMLLVSGNLERIADLATNVSEEVIYLVEGRSVKHHAEATQTTRPPASPAG